MKLPGGLGFKLLAALFANVAMAESAVIDPVMCRQMSDKLQSMPKEAFVSKNQEFQEIHAYLKKTSEEILNLGLSQSETAQANKNLYIDSLSNCFFRRMKFPVKELLPQAICFPGRESKIPNVPVLLQDYYDIQAASESGDGNTAWILAKTLRSPVQYFTFLRMMGRRDAKALIGLARRALVSPREAWAMAREYRLNSVVKPSWTQKISEILGGFVWSLVRRVAPESATAWAENASVEYLAPIATVAGEASLVAFLTVATYEASLAVYYQVQWKIQKVLTLEEQNRIAADLLATHFLKVYKEVTFDPRYHLPKDLLEPDPVSEAPDCSSVNQNSEKAFIRNAFLMKLLRPMEVIQKPAR